MAKNKELLVFIPSIEDGGVEKNLFIILNFLSKKFKKILLITYDKKSQKNFNSNIKLITPFINPEFIKGRYLKYLLCLFVLLKKTFLNKRYLILSFQANIFVIIFCKLFGLNVISRSNSSSVGWSKNKIKQMIFKMFFKKADKIIVNSYDFKKEMNKKYNIKSICILNPFDFIKIKKLSKMRVKNIFSKKTLKLITIGRLTDQKDILTIFKAVKNSQKKIDLELVVIGKGEKETELKNFISSESLEAKVKLLGYKKNPYPYLKQADIFLLASKFEGSPNVLIEALFLNKYVISTNCPTGPKEILDNGKYGDLVKIGDDKMMSKLIEKFNKKRSKSILNKIKPHLQKYDYKVNCKKYYDLISNYL